MLNLLRAGLLALACVFALPATAQECRPFEAMLGEAQDLAAQGYRLDVLTGEAAQRAFAALVAITGEPPRPIDVSAILLLQGEGVAIAVIAEGTQACFWLSLEAETARHLLAAAKGEPA